MKTEPTYFLDYKRTDHDVTVPDLPSVEKIKPKVHSWKEWLVMERGFNKRHRPVTGNILKEELKSLRRDMRLEGYPMWRNRDKEWDMQSRKNIIAKHHLLINRILGMMR